MTVKNITEKFRNNIYFLVNVCMIDEAFILQ